MSVRLLDVQLSVTRQLRELPYPAYLCSMYLIGGEIRRAYLGLLSSRAQELSQQTLDAVRLAARSASSSNSDSALGSGLFHQWEQLRKDPAEDGPAGWFAAVITFCDLSGEISGELEPRAGLMYLTDTAADLPDERAAPEKARLVEISPDEQADEASPKVQMLRWFGRVAQLAAARVGQGLACDPDEILSAMAG